MGCARACAGMFISGAASVRHCRA